MRKFILLKKSILIIIFILILGLFAGCTVLLVPSTGQTGTVYINIINDDWKYHIYLDSYSYFLGSTDYSGQKTFYNIPTGYHTFYAEDVSGWYSGQKTRYIYSGTNNVYIWVY